MSVAFNGIIDAIRSWPRRVQLEQWQLLELLAADLNLQDLLEGVLPSKEEQSVDAVDISQTLSGKSVAIYSITERIAKRAQQLVQQTFDNVTIHLLHDKCCTDRMKSLAQSVEIFLVNTWDAKHAATNGIKKNRQQEMITLGPSSKSASAMLEALSTECR